jgi:hypothetical protein
LDVNYAAVPWKLHIYCWTLVPGHTS